MRAKSLSQRIRTGIKPIADSLGIGGWLRQAYVEMLMVGERTKFSLTGRPPLSSTILLAGSGRSGTTWLADALCRLPGVQQIFEPMHPRFNPDVRRIIGWDKAKETRSDAFNPTYLSDDPERPEWSVAIERALTGRTRNYFTDSARTSFFPDRFLVKDIWINLMLGYIAKRFSPKIIYILRHPCAVVDSRLGVKWSVNVQDILSQSELVEDYLLDFVSDIESETDILGAHAVWWAVENFVALQQLKQFPHFVVYYEDMIIHPERVLKSLLSWLGYETFPSVIYYMLNEPSRTSNHTPGDHGNSKRLASWKSNISQAEQSKILEWAERFELNMYGTEVLPCITYSSLN
jgi:hypothetical protein